MFLQGLIWCCAEFWELLEVEFPEAELGGPILKKAADLRCFGFGFVVQVFLLFVPNGYRL